MCIVQVNNNLGVSCALNLMNNMIIFSNTLRVKEARESILEFLLINHPLDCPIRDQGGECDLQDLSLIFGADRGRFYEFKKRAIDNFSSNGPLIKTMMTRCIHCTRCVRYASEISDFSLGILDRGSTMEIGMYFSFNLLDEISGNIIDLCPVGASTSMPYAFKYRPWEVTYFNNIDFLDSMCSSIRLHIYANKIIRILPLLDEDLNEEWLSNRTRFSYDAMLINRNFYPKLKFFQKFIVFSWDFIINYLYIYLIKNLYLNINFISYIGYYIDLASCLALKTFFLNFGCLNIMYLNNLYWIYDVINLCYFNSTLTNLELINFFFFINCDIRLEAPLLNIRIKKNYNLHKNRELYICSFGLSLKYLSYPIKHLGNAIRNFFCFLEGKLRYYCNLIIKEFYTFMFFNLNYYFYNKPLFIFGNSILGRIDSKSILMSFLVFLKNKFSLSTFSLLYSFFGFYSFTNIIYNINKNVRRIKGFIYNLTGESLLTTDINYLQSFIINQGFFNNYNNCNIILPSAAPYEMDMLVLNLEGRYKLIKQNIKSHFGLFTNWEIIFFLVLYKKKYINLYIFLFFKFFTILSYFQIFINFFCNFFLSLENFFLEFFFFTGYLINQNFIVIMEYSIQYIYVVKIINNIWFRFVNNFYSMDFYTKNSKIMAFSALKKYLIYR